MYITIIKLKSIKMLIEIIIELTKCLEYVVILKLIIL